MLVLTRNAHQEITIGKSVRIVVLGVRGSRVRLGLFAPDMVKIHRAETNLPKSDGRQLVMNSPILNEILRPVE
jgi:carbon storage regulator